MSAYLHHYDLPETLPVGPGDLALDCEAMGLRPHRDRLCVLQLSDGQGDAHLVHFPTPDFRAPNLKRLLAEPGRTMLFHFARFDVALIQHYLGVRLTHVYCTRTASRLVRTYTDRHGLREVCRELLGVEISKQQQSSYWGTEALSAEQIAYAAADVTYLHQLREEFNRRLAKEQRLELALATMQAIPVRAWLDLEGWADTDLFAHA